jgi:hypothetical protein
VSWLLATTVVVVVVVVVTMTVVVSVINNDCSCYYTCYQAGPDSFTSCKRAGQFFNKTGQSHLNFPVELKDSVLDLLARRQGQIYIQSVPIRFVMVVGFQRHFGCFYNWKHYRLRHLTQDKYYWN